MPRVEGNLRAQIAERAAESGPECAAPGSQESAVETRTRPMQRAFSRVLSR